MRGVLPEISMIIEGQISVINYFFLLHNLTHLKSGCELKNKNPFKWLNCIKRVVWQISLINENKNNNNCTPIFTISTFYGRLHLLCVMLFWHNFNVIWYGLVNMREGLEKTARKWIFLLEKIDLCFYAFTRWGKEGIF